MEKVATSPTKREGRVHPRTPKMRRPSPSLEEEGHVEQKVSYQTEKKTTSPTEMSYHKRKNVGASWEFLRIPEDIPRGRSSIGGEALLTRGKVALGKKTSSVFS